MTHGERDGVGRVEAELAGLASSGATALVGLMVSDAWGQVRGRLAAFFARGGDPGGIDRQLQDSHAALVGAREAGDEDTAADVADEWRARLRRVLRADPGAADELRSLLAELAPGTSGGGVSIVNNSVSGGIHHGIIQGRDFLGPATAHDDHPPAPPTG
ncbi:hypothetical protein SAMN05216223_106280 [Actinacidiphila yanglinensis]|uniref:Uncharacterized protein n=1 Tax=Actinacidiphila yanglinensis TaxID=310779 RepID=A0A1H6B6L7_9ACTN|nr:hypothetical protein [Actinacidiphila yanglinensis]SEG56489.1 hypothetical protein SAMN05216223_106280 [Actinacidiphila yanglinensis]